MLNLCEARVLVLDESFFDQVADIADSLFALDTVIVRGDPGRAKRHLKWRVVRYDDVSVSVSDTDNPQRQVDGGDTGMILYTSGTTGPSKGCVLSHRFLIHQAEIVCEHFRVTCNDTLYTAFPLFHGDATCYTVLPALLSGSRAAIGERFSASRHWDEIRRFGATVFDFIGATLTILWKRLTQSVSSGRRPCGTRSAA